MSRPHTSPRRRRDDDGEEEEELAPPSISAIEALGLIRPLGRPYQTDEEKEKVFSDLIALKMLRMTNVDCAEKLGVSVRTVVNYLADPYYKELVAARETEAHEGARLLVSELAYKSLQTMDRLMDGAKSEFVQFKAAETIGTWLGLEFPREDVRADAREEVARFLQEAMRRGVVIQPVLEGGREPASPVNVNILVQQGEAPRVVESHSEVGSQYPQVLPGGRLPPAFLGGEHAHEQENTGGAAPEESE